MSRRQDAARTTGVMALVVAVTAAFGAVVSDAAPAMRVAAADPATCVGSLPGQEPPAQPAPPLRFGISPNVTAGQVGPAAAPAVPDDPQQDMRWLSGLRAAGEPFVLRLTRLFWSDGEPALQAFAAAARDDVANGFDVEIQLRYHPTTAEEGDIAAWTAYVRHAVDVFAAIPGVIAIQVTNEVNFTLSADSSDGAFQDARDALIQGVIAAHDEARRDHAHGLSIGFNWFYRNEPETEAQFWTYLRDHGGAALVDATDWVGLDAYPGTFFPPVDTPGGWGDAMVNALSELRDCFLPVPGIPLRTPIHIEENGWPTNVARSAATQADALDSMVAAVIRARGAFDVTDYRWFNLRDADSSSPNFQQQFGLLTDHYLPKPAFSRYASWVRADSGGHSGGAPLHPQSSGGGGMAAHVASLPNTARSGAAGAAQGAFAAVLLVASVARRRRASR